MNAKTDARLTALGWELRASHAVFKLLQSGRYRNAWTADELFTALESEGVATTRHWVAEQVGQLVRFGVVECTRHSHTALSGGWVRCNALCLYRWRGLGSRLPFNPGAIEDVR